MPENRVLKAVAEII